MKFYYIRNWDQFQHYTSRNPPWIKLHFEILNSQDWLSLSDHARLVAVVCMLIASRHSGQVPADPLYIKRAGRLNARVDFKPLIECGFLSETLADAIIETETETEKKDIGRSKSIRPDDNFGNFKRSYPKREGSNPWKPAFSIWKQAVKLGADPAKIISGALAYRLECEKLKTEPRMIAQAQTWLRQSRWDDYAQQSNGHEYIAVAPYSDQWGAWRARMIALGEPVKFMDAQAEKGIGWGVPTEYPGAI